MQWHSYIHSASQKRGEKKEITQKVQYIRRTQKEERKKIKEQTVPICYMV
jgi:hypothetical protein